MNLVMLSFSKTPGFSRRSDFLISLIIFNQLLSMLKLLTFVSVWDTPLLLIHVKKLMDLIPSIGMSLEI
jgi:hypothetical protein